MSKHSKGEWTWKAEHLNSITIRVDGVEIATVFADNLDRLTDQQKADARLIAAAPALYNVVAYVATHKCAHPANPGGCHYCAARAAIAKANGR